MIENIKLLGNFDIENYFFDELGNWYFAHDLYVFFTLYTKSHVMYKKCGKFSLDQVFFSVKSTEGK